MKPNVYYIICIQLSSALYVLSQKFHALLCLLHSINFVLDCTILPKSTMSVKAKRSELAVHINLNMPDVKWIYTNGRNGHIQS